MAIDINDIVNDVKEQEADIGYLEPLKFKFKISFYTPLIGAKLRAAEDPMAVQVELMADAITWWDMVESGVDERGNKFTRPLEVSVDNLNRLSVTQLNAIYSAMEELAFPPKTKAAS